MYRATAPNHHVTESPCLLCPARGSCLGKGLGDIALNKLTACGQIAKPLKKGQVLYQAGGAPDTLFCVKSGSVKTVRLNENGEQQVTGFYFPGMLFGLADLSQPAREDYAEGLEQGAVCAFAVADIRRLMAQESSLLSNLLEQLSTQIRVQQQLAAFHEADAKLFYYLRHVRQRLSRPGLPLKGFSLSMTNRDLASYLQLRPETLSRRFAELKKRGELILKGRQVLLTEVLDEAA